ncbi:PadR family transcriptional regulator [Actinocrinis sp.]|uniref:PadR family transcriptional regulator n=1 Tax=Actinocrinis sp. TaxID=1920516 RepID=UPI002D44F759|nr:PadR family transcriptional regulator [Actinocrinis sp.]HZP53267.1 PadR family transcriptional regulator [Actinocrinis sp.]
MNRDDSPAINPTAASLLGFLHDGPLTGWDLAAWAEQVIGPFWSLTRSQVYRELAAMAQSGLVEPGPVGRRDARPYAITEAGRQAFAHWAAAGPGEATMRLPLLLFVALGRHIAPHQLAAILREQREHQAGLLAEYLKLRKNLEAAESAADPHLMAILEYGIASARTTLRWIDGLPPELTGTPDRLTDPVGYERPKP